MVCVCMFAFQSICVAAFMQAGHNSGPGQCATV